MPGANKTWKIIIFARSESELITLEKKLEPIVDGIIIDPSVSGSPMGDISPDDVQNIEIIKGQQEQPNMVHVLQMVLLP